MRGKSKSLNYFIFALKLHLIFLQQFSPLSLKPEEDPEENQKQILKKEFFRYKTSSHILQFSSQKSRSSVRQHFLHARDFLVCSLRLFLRSAFNDTCFYDFFLCIACAANGFVCSAVLPHHIWRRRDLCIRYKSPWYPGTLII